MGRIKFSEVVQKKFIVYMIKNVNFPLRFLEVLFIIKKKFVNRLTELANPSN